MALALNWRIDRARVPLQIHQRARIGFNYRRARAQSEIAAGIPTARILSYARRVHRILHPALSLECAARLDHARPFKSARRHRTGFGRSSWRIARLSRPAFPRLLSINLSRYCLGGDRFLETFPAAAEPLVPDVVRTARLPLLYTALNQQSCGTQLGRTCFSQFRSACARLLA